MTNYLVFADDFEPTQDQIGCLKRVNRAIEDEVNDRVIEMMLYETTLVGDKRISLFPEASCEEYGRSMARDLTECWNVKV